MTVQHSDDDAALYRRISDGDIKARNDMAERHLGLAQSLATYYAKRNPHLTMDDLLQEGRFGIIVALQKFDVDKGYRFSTYATYWIKHYIQRYVIENHSGGATARKKDTEDYIGRRMSDDERRIYEHRCIDHMSMSSSGPTHSNLDEIIEDRDAVPVDEQSCSRLEWNGVERNLFHETIHPTQRTVVCMRFGVMGFAPHTIAEVSSKLGIPSARVTAVEQEAIVRLQRIAEGTDGDH